MIAKVDLLSVQVTDNSSVYFSSIFLFLFSIVLWHVAISIKNHTVLKIDLDPYTVILTR